MENWNHYAYVKNVLINRKLKVKFNNCMSDTIPLYNDIRQGLPLCLVLFIIAFNLWNQLCRLSKIEKRNLSVGWFGFLSNETKFFIAKPSLSISEFLQLSQNLNIFIKLLFVKENLSTPVAFGEAFVYNNISADFNTYHFF